MGIPQTSHLMPVVHIYPINPGTGEFVTVGEVKDKLRQKANRDVDPVVVGGNDSDRFDLGTSFNFQRMSLEAGRSLDCVLEFVDPTFSHFEAIMAAINRDATTEMVGQLRLGIRFGWVASGLTPSQLVYPLFRDNRLRTGQRLQLVNGELLTDPFFVTIYRMTYSVQTTGIRYTMVGPYVTHASEQLHSQSDKVFKTENLSYLTIFYYLASEMNILIKFDNVDLKLLTHGPSRFALENKQHVDNMTRLLNAINKGSDGSDRSKSVLNLSISNREEDARDALAQMGSLNSRAQEELSKIENSKLFKAAAFLNRNALGAFAAGGITGLSASLLAKPVVQRALENQRSNNVTLFKLPDDERIKASEYITKIINHWKAVESSNVKDWKTYVITEYPAMFSNETPPEVVYNTDTSITLKNKSYVFLGVYAHFAKDIQNVQSKENGYDTSVGLITSTNVTLDDSIWRINQQKEYRHIMERTGRIINHFFNLVKSSQDTLGTQVAKSAKAIEASAVNVNINSITGKKTPTLGPVLGPIFNPLNSNFFLKPLIIGGALAAEKITQPAVQKQAESRQLLKAYEAQVAGVPENTSKDDILKALGDKNGVLSQNPYVKDHHLLDRIMPAVEQNIKKYITPSINNEDKDVLIVKQIAIYSALTELIREGNRLAALNLSYNKLGMQITVKVLGDLALGTELMGNGLMYVKFFNNNGTINNMLTGFYLLMGYKHELTATGTFNTEMNLMAYQLKGISEGQANAPGGGIQDILQSPNNINFPPPPPNGGTLVSAFEQQQLAQERSFSLGLGTTYTQNPVTTTKTNTGITLPEKVKVLTSNTAVVKPTPVITQAQLSSLSTKTLITQGSAVGLRLPAPVLTGPLLGIR